MSSATARRAAAPAADPEQDRLLNEAKQMVSRAAGQMKRCLDEKDITGALKHASDMISELRTSLLNPRAYFSLYLFVCSHLRHFEMVISDPSFDMPLYDLYKLVQHCGNIVPRLYLLITVGCVYIQSMKVPAKEVLKDLVELCGGVQQATRGLFLRNYLSEMTKDKLPDEGGKYEGDVTDSVDFIVKNFTEMNKLWVRMQRGQGTTRDPQRLEEERKELNILVCKNLDRLSHLEGLSIGLYRSDALPRILKQICQCEDRIAQQYLMETLIQANSDEFHLRTLDQLFEACGQLVSGVDVYTIVSSLIKRLTNYLQTYPHAKSIPEKDLFTTFFDYIRTLITDKAAELENVVLLCNSLLELGLSVYGDDIERIDSIYEFVHKVVSEGQTGPVGKEVAQQLLSLLKAPVSHFKGVIPVLGVKSYLQVITLLPLDDKKEIAKVLIDSLLVKETKIQTAEEVDTFLQYISVFVISNPSLDAERDTDPSWEDNQSKVSYAISLFQSPNVEVEFAILLKCFQHFKEGGKIRYKYTIVPLIFKSLLLVRKIYAAKDSDEDWEKKAKKVFKYSNDLVEELKSASELDLTYRLYLECALAAGNCGLHSFVYGFLTKGALTIYEEDTASKSQVEFNAIRLLLATVNQLNCIQRGNYDVLAKRIAKHSANLVNLDERSIAVSMSAHLFKSQVVPDEDGGSEFKDGAAMLQCLKRSMNLVADIHESDTSFNLLVELLDRFLYFFTHHDDVVTQDHVLAILGKVKAEFQSKSPEKDNIGVKHLKNIKHFLAYQQNWKNHAKVSLERLEQAYYAENPLPEGKSKAAEKDKIKEKVRAKFLPQAEKEGREEAAKWKDIKF
eukprot:TRINITY_DN15815_c0_g1_i1.p1 TRINITY_DN15815_c0_g1~~TRINITY_DN15815_c0_g1_i1.p1  ORF type:complete len:844 (-),score=226.43 TRINITY_DN15815_c0_g1_i1:34-2565(-)